MKIRTLIRLSAASLWRRRVTALLTLMSVAFATLLFIGVERVRTSLQTGFNESVAGIDLIVGARGSPLALLMQSVFGLGDPINNVDYENYQRIAKHPSIAWTVPIALGDSHRGFRVIGTSGDWFDHAAPGGQAFVFKQGQPFDTPLQTVIGASVAATLGYSVGEKIVLAHGTDETALLTHDNLPFEVVGILAATGAPADYAIMIPLEGIEALHRGWESGVPIRQQVLSTDQANNADLSPKTITAFYVGMKDLTMTFQVQRAINEYRREPLTAILPGVAMQQLWQLMRAAQGALTVAAVLAMVCGLLSTLVALLSTLNERRREMAILRAIGARPTDVFSLLVAESFLYAVLGGILGMVLVYLALLVGVPWIRELLGVRITLAWPATNEWILLAMVAASGVLIGLVPAWRAYRLSLQDGLSVRA